MIKSNRKRWLFRVLAGLILPITVEAKQDFTPHPFTQNTLQQILKQPPAILYQQQQLRQLNNWFAQGNRNALNTWIQAHPKKALSLSQELYIDLQVSPWLGLPPQYVGGQKLLPILAQALHQPGWLDANCVKKSDQLKCQGIPGIYELRYLQNMQISLSTLPAEVQFDIPGPREDIQPSTLIAMLIDADLAKVFNPQKMTRRGKLQQAIFKGVELDQDDDKRLQILSQALIEARMLQARQMELLLLLSMVHIVQASYKNKHELFGLRYDDPALVALLQEILLTAKERAKGLPDFEIAILLKQVLVESVKGNRNKLLAQAEAKIQNLKDRNLADSLGIRQADVLWQLNEKDQALRHYQYLLKADKTSIRILAVQSLVRSGSAKWVLALKQRFASESNPEVKAALVEAFTYSEASAELPALLAHESKPVVRRAIVQALSKVQAEWDEKLNRPLSHPYLNLLFALTQDKDSEIRSTAASTLSNEADPNVHKRFLAWVDSPYPELQSRALDEISNHQLRQYLPQAIALLKSPDFSLQVKAAEFVGQWGGPAQVPALEALLPQFCNPILLNQLHIDIARMKGKKDFLQEIAHQLGQESDELETQLGQFEVLNRFQQAIKEGKLTANDIRPWLQDPNPRLQDLAAHSGLFQPADIPRAMIERQDAFVLKQLSSSDPFESEGALQALQTGALANKALPQVIHLLDDPKLGELALDKLAEISPKEAIQRLLALLKHPRLGPHALVKLNRLAPAMAEKYLPELLQHPSAAMRLAAANLAAAHTVPLNLLLPLLKDPSPDIRLEVANQLSYRDDPLARKALKSLLMDKELKLRLLAVKALGYYEERGKIEDLPGLLAVFALKEVTPLPKEKVIYSFDIESWEKGMDPTTEEELLKGQAMAALLDGSTDPLPYLLPLLQHPRLGLALIQHLGMAELEKHPASLRLLRLELQKGVAPGLKEPLKEFLNK